MTVYTLTREPGSKQWHAESVSNNGDPRREMHIQNDEQMLDFIRAATADPGHCVVSVLCGQDRPVFKIHAA